MTVAIHFTKLGWPWLLGGAAVCYAALSYDWAAVLPVIARISPGRFLALETILLLCVFATCAWRWGVVTGLVARGAEALQIYMYNTVSIAIGQVTPMQLGETLKIRFARSNGLPTRRSTLSMVVERIVDLAVVIDLALTALMRRCGVSFGVAGLADLAFFTVLLSLPTVLRWSRSRFHALARLSLLDDAEQILKPSRLSLLIALTIVKWVVSALSWQVALYCVGCWIGLADCLLTIATVSIVTMLSMVPGGLGIQELSLTAMLTALGNPPDVAQAGSIAVRLLLPIMVVLGLAHLPGVVWGQPFLVSRRS